MARICEVCGRIEQVEDNQHPYDMIDVCPECTQHLVHTHNQVENE
ncbi:hypothetical protein GCM10008967_15810 [Bacillus carboniphilus]|uniref:Uncharacterized protein n=1 Tax=Bacillus carboniphilus TaxID=86663 RepID=A0ABP3FWF3_9BACI